MFWRLRRMSHRAKLTIALTLFVSAALALVFLTVTLFVRQQSLSRRFAELRGSVSRIAKEWSGPDVIAEEKEDYPGIEFSVYDASGKLLVTSTKTAIPLMYGDRKDGSRILASQSANSVVVVGSASWAETESGLRQLAGVLALLWLPLTLLTAAAAWYGGGIVLRPVTELVASADRLTQEVQGGLLETSDKAEFAALAASLNALIAKVRASAEIQEQFASDAAHELRSPLARMRIRIETALLNERTVSEYQTSLQGLLQTTDELTSLVESLLSSARAHSDAGALALALPLTQIVKAWQQGASATTPSIEVTSEPCSAIVTPEEWTIIIRNLLDNALRHAPLDSDVSVKLATENGAAVLTVHNAGEPLSEEDQAQAFNRFFRSDEDRGRGSGGAGIGLAIVKRIAESRQGSVGFRNSPHGVTVFVSLPLLTTSQDAPDNPAPPQD